MNANYSREALETLRCGKSPELEICVMETFGRAFRRGQETLAEQTGRAFRRGQETLAEQTGRAFRRPAASIVEWGQETLAEQSASAVTEYDAISE